MENKYNKKALKNESSHFRNTYLKNIQKRVQINVIRVAVTRELH